MSTSVTKRRVVVDSTPYAWPYHGGFDPKRTALVALQDGSWRGPSTESDECDVRLVRLAHLVGSLGGLVVIVTSTPARRTLGDELSGFSGGHAEGMPSGVLSFADVVLDSGATSAFFSSRLDDLLPAHGRTDLIVAGWGLEGPVHSTLRAANDRGYECLLVPDASTSLDEGLRFAAGEMVRFSGGIFGAICTTNDVLAALGGEYEPRRPT